MSITKSQVLFYDRDSASVQDYTRRATRNLGVLFGQNSYFPEVELTRPDRAQDFLEFPGALTVVGQRSFDAYILHTMAQDVSDVILAILLHATEQPDLTYRIGLIGHSSDVKSQTEKIMRDAAELGVRCNIHHLPSAPNGYLNDGPQAEQVRDVLKEMLK